MVSAAARSKSRSDGDFDDLVGRNGRAFARRVEIGVAHDAVAGLELGNPRAYAFDHAGELATGRERKRRFGLVFAGDDQGVEEIQADRRDLGHDLARSGHRLRDIREHEVIGRAETLTENGFHGWAARTVSGRRYSMDGVERRRRGWLPRIGYVYSGCSRKRRPNSPSHCRIPQANACRQGLVFQ